MNKKPHFLVIGAHKSATVWVYAMLKKNPEIYLTPLNEIHYFDRSDAYASPNISKRFLNRWWRRSFKKLITSKDRKTRFWFFKYLFGVYNDRWYVSLFSDAKANAKCGEVTPSYSMLEVEDIQKVYKINPDMKIIFMMRNPIERAWSGFLHSLKVGNRNYEEMSESNVISELRSESNVKRGDYLKTIDNWTSVFPEKQFQIFYFEDVVQRPKQMLQDMFAFIGVSDDLAWHTIELHKKIHESQKMPLPEKYREFLQSLHNKKIQLLYDRVQSPIIKSWLDQKQ